MNFIFIIIAIVIVFIIWQARNMRIAKAGRLSEKKQKESLEAKGREELRAEERIIEVRESRKQQAEDEEKDRKTKVERDLREGELRRQIKDRKDHEAGGGS